LVIWSGAGNLSGNTGSLPVWLFNFIVLLGRIQPGDYSPIGPVFIQHKHVMNFDERVGGVFVWVFLRSDSVRGQMSMGCGELSIPARAGV